MKTIEITGYQTSRDYALLCRLMRESSILCTVRNAHFATSREAATTRFLHNGDGPHTMMIGSPGIQYVYAQDAEDFTNQCGSQEVEFLLPTNREAAHAAKNAEQENALRARALIDTPAKVLPTVQGWYWWREKDTDDWRMVDVIHISGSGGDRLLTTDADDSTWSMRSVKEWRDLGLPVGEWLYVHPPAVQRETASVVSGS